MNGFSDCSGNCCVCLLGEGLCLAGHGDDDFILADKQQIIDRLDNGTYRSYRKEMIQTLKHKYGYEYQEEEDGLH